MAAYVADLLAQVRYHLPAADTTITLDELLTGIRAAVHDMPAEQAGVLIAGPRTQVPVYFAVGVTSRPGRG